MSEIDDAKHYLATQLMNQVGEEWDDCCDSAQLIADRLSAEGLSDNAAASRLYGEAARYEDM